MIKFNETLALSLLTSEKEFPVSLDDAYVWLGYTRKESAKDKLLSTFEEGTDYVRESPESDNHGTFSPQEIAAKSRKEHIYLTVDCFKQLGMVAGTEKGKEIRRYFLNCEKLLKEQQNLNNLVLSGDVATTLLAFIQEQKQLTSNLMERTKKLDQIEEASKTHKGARAVIDSENDESYSIADEYISVDQYLVSIGLLEITSTAKNAIHRRAASFYRTDTHREPRKIANKNVYVGTEIEYIRQAVKSVLGL